MTSDIFSRSYRIKKKFKEIAGFLLYGRTPTNPNNIGVAVRTASLISNASLVLAGGYFFNEVY
jgi:hypothetical protein